MTETPKSRTDILPETIEMVDDQMAAIYRSMTGAQRLAIAHGMFSSARKMLLSHLRTEHPDWSEEEVNREGARRLSRGELVEPK